MYKTKALIVTDQSTHSSETEMVIRRMISRVFRLNLGFEEIKVFWTNLGSYDFLLCVGIFLIG